jgi:hypothetical protein
MNVLTTSTVIVYFLYAFVSHLRITILLGHVMDSTELLQNIETLLPYVFILPCSSLHVVWHVRVSVSFTT